MSAELVKSALRVLEARGHDGAMVLARSGVEPAAIASASARVPYAQVDALIETVAELVPAPELGLELARAQDPTAYGAAGLLLMASSNFRQGLRLSLGYQRIWGDGERFSIAEDAGRRCRVSFRHPGTSPLARAVLAECALAEIAAGARVLVAPDALPLAVEFVHPPLGDTARLGEYFGVVPRHRSPANSVVFAASVADRPLHLLRDTLVRAFEDQASHALAALPEHFDFARRVRSVLTEVVEQNPTLGAIARRFGMSARTLQRRLWHEGTSFQALLDLERRERADALLSRGARLKEAAFRVGYADPSALTRARRRWSR